MITLFKFGPAWGLPDPSPFVTKAELLLKIAGLPYETNLKGFRKAPKGKLPYIDDDGEIVADSTFIRAHVERKYRFDFDRGLSAEQKGLSWAIEKMCEDHLYWLVVHARWLEDANFARGPSVSLNAAPAPIRPLLKAFVRRSLRRTLRGQGLGRHSDAERAELGRRDLGALSAILGDKPFFMGAEPTGLDAAAGAFVIGTLAKLFVTPLRDAAEALPNLVAYRDRMMKGFYPDFVG